MNYGKRYSPDGDAGGAAAAAGEGAAAAGAAAAGAAGAAAAQAGAAGAGDAGAGAAGVSDWTSGLNPDLKGYVQTKGFKDVATVLETARGLEKHFGVPKEQLLKMPAEDAAPEVWAQFHQRLGKPEKAEDYKIETPKEGGNPEFAEWAKKTFHESHLTVKQADVLLSKWNEFSKHTAETQNQEFVRQSQEQHSKLETEWGKAYEQNKAQAAKAAKAFGVDEKTVDQMQSVMGFDATMKFFHKIGSKLSEDKFVGGDTPPGFNNILTPESARLRIDLLKKDMEFGKKLMAKDAKATSEWSKLHEEAYSEDSA